VKHVACDDGVGAWPANVHRIMVDRVAGRWDQRYQIVECVRALDDIDTIGGYDREHGIGHPWTSCWIILLALGPVSQLAVGEYIACLREGRNPPAVLKPRVPPDVVSVQMRAHDKVDNLHTSSGSQFSISRKP
jgi:hypothetical protein